MSKSNELEDAFKELNDLMEETFGTRPMFNGMLEPNGWVLTLRLLIHWIKEAKKVAKK
jgi:hypothetical protein